MPLRTKYSYSENDYQAEDLLRPATTRHYRLLFAVASSTYLIWWFVVEHVLDDAFNPLGSRLFICSLFIISLGLSFVYEFIKKNLRLIYSAWAFLLTTHYFYLFAHNVSDQNWVVGGFITVLAVGTTLETLPILLAYSVLVLFGSLYVASYSSIDAVSFPGIITVLVLVNIIAYIRARADRERRLRLVAEAEKSTERIVNQAKMLFLANVNHELRTPLSSIIGYSDILAMDDDLSEDHQLYLDRIRVNAKALLGIVEQILTLTENEIEALPMEEGPIDVRSFIASRTQAEKVACDGKGLDLALNFSENLPNLILTDRRHVGQIYRSVLNNAVKFTDKGAINVDVRHVPLSEPNLVRIEIGVKDTGIGIIKEQWEKIFESFNQVQNNYDRPYGGTGLGLTVARMLGRALGGDVMVEQSAVGQGTTMLITLQAKLPAQSGR